jgi:cytochrome c peroxidase
MHDGQFADLEAVIDFYNDLPISGSLGHREATLRPLKLNASERRALLAFLKTL